MFVITFLLIKIAIPSGRTLEDELEDGGIILVRVWCLPGAMQSAYTTKYWNYIDYKIKEWNNNLIYAHNSLKVKNYLLELSIT